ncbi:MAG: hypothetical protein ACLUD1_05495 [Clostridia bacterium]
MNKTTSRKRNFSKINWLYLPFVLLGLVLIYMCLTKNLPFDVYTANCAEGLVNVIVAYGVFTGWFPLLIGIAGMFRL